MLSLSIMFNMAQCVVLAANEIGTPDPNLEPQITSLGTCKIDKALLEATID